MKSPEMLALMRDWEDKKIEHENGQAVRLQLGDILDQVEMDVGTFKAVVEEFNTPMVSVT